MDEPDRESKLRGFDRKARLRTAQCRSRRLFGDVDIAGDRLGQGQEVSALLQVWWAHERRGVTVWAGGSASSRRSVEWGGGGDRARTAPGVSGRFPRHPNPPARPCAPPHCSRRPSASSQPSSRGSSLSPTGSSATFGRPRESLDAAGARAVSGKAMTPGNHACGDTSTWAE